MYQEQQKKAYLNKGAAQFIASIALLAVVIVPSAINRFKYPNETSKRVPLPVHEFTDSRNIDMEIIDFN